MLVKTPSLKMLPITVSPPTPSQVRYTVATTVFKANTWPPTARRTLAPLTRTTQPRSCGLTVVLRSAGLKPTGRGTEQQIQFSTILNTQVHYLTSPAIIGSKTSRRGNKPLATNSCSKFCCFLKQSTDQKFCASYEETKKADRSTQKRLRQMRDTRTSQYPPTLRKQNNRRKIEYMVKKSIYFSQWQQNKSTCHMSISTAHDIARLCHMLQVYMPHWSAQEPCPNSKQHPIADTENSNNSLQKKNFF